jgi:hypothetical protein
MFSLFTDILLIGSMTICSLTLPNYTFLSQNLLY